VTVTELRLLWARPPVPDADEVEAIVDLRMAGSGMDWWAAARHVERRAIVETAVKMAEYGGAGTQQAVRTAEWLAMQAYYGLPRIVA
jgi:hypothetical protein